MSAGNGVNKEVESIDIEKNVGQSQGKANIFEIKFVLKKRRYRKSLLKG